MCVGRYAVTLVLLYVVNVAFAYSWNVPKFALVLALPKNNVPILASSVVILVLA